MCTKPVTAYQPKIVNSDGTRPLVFKQPELLLMYQFDKIKVPCGKCLECKKANSLSWGVRAYFEIHQSIMPSWFVTLTYDDDHLPEHRSLKKKHAQAFHKKLKRNFIKSKYLTSGEYGEHTDRPHYHSVIFNLLLDDLVLYKEVKGKKYYTSKILTDFWGMGQVLITDANTATAQYVAQYTAKKVNGNKSLNHYAEYDSETGELIKYREPEFLLVSKKPSIGVEFFNKYIDDIYNQDNVVIAGGAQRRPPKYIDKLLKRTDPVRYEMIKAERTKRIIEKTPEENAYRDKVKLVLEEKKRKGRML